MSAAVPAVGPIVIGDLTIDRERRRVVRDGEDIRLTPKEFDLRVFLSQHSRPCADAPHNPRCDLGTARRGPPEHLRVLVAALRKKIELDPTRPVLHHDGTVDRVPPQN
jgi:two-component system KDP operon response regulator KdpE